MATAGRLCSPRTLLGRASFLKAQSGDISRLSHAAHGYAESSFSTGRSVRLGKAAVRGSSQPPRGWTIQPSGGGRASFSVSASAEVSTDPVSVKRELRPFVKRTRIVKIKEGVDEAGKSLVGEEITVKAWVRTVRDQKEFSFIELNDGSSMKGLQAVVPTTAEGYSYLTDGLVGTGASVTVTGTVAESPAKGQKVELKASSIELVGGADGATYPLQKKRHSLEFLRSIAHLRPRTNAIAAVTRVRSALAFATHEFFQGNGFQYVHTPILTSSDCEGAGEQFLVTTMLQGDGVIPKGVKDKFVFDRDFFAKPAYLTVSGQLNAEIYACALNDVYTFGPTFRAENSNTSRHLAEFWMIEPEMAFCDLEGDMACAEAYLKHCINHVLEHCPEDVAFFDSFISKGIKKRLESVASQPFATITYTEGVDMLLKADKEFEFPVEWGSDLQSEHERYLTEVVFEGTPLIVTDYPKGIKAFYMRENDDGRTVAAMDMLVPGVGELMGGSQREERLDVLERRLEEVGLPKENYWWYLELRKYGSVPHAGFGLGFERLVQYCTGMENIRDVIPFPRYPGSAEF